MYSYKDISPMSRRDSPVRLELLERPASMGARGEKEDTSSDVHIDKGKSKLRKIEADTVPTVRPLPCPVP